MFKLYKLTNVKLGTPINYMNISKQILILEFITTTWENKFLILETNEEQSVIFSEGRSESNSRFEIKIT